MKNKLEVKLCKLVESGAITSFLIQDLNEDGFVGHSQSRNTQRLIVTFPNGERLILGTYCSGCLEDSGFCIEGVVVKDDALLDDVNFLAAQ